MEAYDPSWIIELSMQLLSKNCYPIPRIADLIELLSKASIFTKIDLRWGYNNFHIKEEDEWKTAFITRQGLFEATVMYFRFSNAPATFQSMMNDILRDLICIRLVMVYLDNILIFGTCLKEHRRLVKKVLKRLQFNDLYAKAEKCFFEQSSIKYLGVIISENKVQMDDITKGHLLICDLILEYLKRLRKRVLDSDKRCC